MSEHKYRNFDAALSKLESFLAVYGGAEIECAGLIQAFEFTFEQCWKALQKEASAQGVIFASPKKAYEWAMAAGLIDRSAEEIWRGALSD